MLPPFLSNRRPYNVNSIVSMGFVSISINPKWQVSDIFPVVYFVYVGKLMKVIVKVDMVLVGVIDVDITKF